MSRIYLDFAAATPVDDRVIAAMQPYFAGTFYNPSALYKGAREAKSDLEDARSKVAQQIGARSSEIIFTAGGTESTNLAIHGIMSVYENSEIIVSAIEHEAVLRPAESYKNSHAGVDHKGRVILSNVEKLITDKTVLISIMLANNEVGTLQPIKEVVQLVEKVRKNRKQSGNSLPLYVHTDACQAPLYVDINVARLGVDMMTLNGGKIYGPKQSGILYRKANVLIEPMIKGGGQEWGMRSGTENVAFAIGFARALELAEKGRAERTKQVQDLRDFFIDAVTDRFNAEITGHTKHRLANNVHAIFPGTDNERVLFALDDLGVDAASGSACSASSEEASHVLLAMGYDEQQARSSVRFTLGKETTKQDIISVIDKLEIALKA